MTVHQLRDTGPLKDRKGEWTRARCGYEERYHGRLSGAFTGFDSRVTCPACKPALAMAPVTMVYNDNTARTQGGGTMPLQGPPAGGFRPTPQATQPGGISDDDDELEGERKQFAKHDILKHRTVGDYVLGVVVDFSDTVPDKDPVTNTQKQYGDKLKYQDVITMLVLDGQGVVTKAGTRNEGPLEVDSVVTEWVSGHNKYDPDRPEQFGMSWRVAKDTLGRGLKVGDLVRIDYVVEAKETWSGVSLGIPKKVKAYQCAAPSTAEEFALVERARAERKRIKGGAPAPQADQPAQRIVAQPAATAAPAAPAVKGLWD